MESLTITTASSCYRSLKYQSSHDNQQNPKYKNKSSHPNQQEPCKQEVYRSFLDATDLRAAANSEEAVVYNCVMPDAADHLREPSSPRLASPDAPA